MEQFSMGGHAKRNKIKNLILVLSTWFVCGMVAQQQYVSTYGVVIDSEKHESKNAIVERVVIYPQAASGSAKRIVRNGIIVRNDNAEATILVCHGFMCDKWDAGVLRRLFPKRRFNVMVFDFRAHGENPEGQYCTFGRDEALDIIAAVKFIRSHPQLKDKPIFAYGFSMGAVALIEAQARDSSLFKAMILDCPFDSTENVLKRGLANIRFTLFGYQFSMPCRRLLEKYAFHPYVQSLVKAILRTIMQLDPQHVSINVCRVCSVESVKKIKVPCFFIHCKYDEKTSVAGIKSIFDSAAGPKMLWLTRGRRHFDSYFYNPEGYTNRVRTFLNKVLSGSFQKGVHQQIIEDDDDSNCVFCLERG